MLSPSRMAVRIRAITTKSRLSTSSAPSVTRVLADSRFLASTIPTPTTPLSGPTDLAEAHWLGSSYVITAIEKGCATDTNSFHLAGILEEDKRFEEEEIRVIADPEFEFTLETEREREDDRP